MANASPFLTASNSPFGSLQPLFDWQTVVIESLMQMQQMQLQMLAAWMRPCTATHQELWDQWIARFGGGVPID